MLVWIYNYFFLIKNRKLAGITKMLRVNKSRGLSLTPNTFYLSDVCKIANEKKSVNHKFRNNSVYKLSKR